MEYSRKELVEKLKYQISVNPKKAQDALLEIYKHQTVSEQEQGYTQVNNGVGFSGVDSEFLSSLAESLIKYKRLSDKQNFYLMKIMPKYANQLIGISIGKGFIVKVGRKYEIKKIEKPIQKELDFN